MRLLRQITTSSTNIILDKMTEKTAYFRCDASAQIGGGHVMRCLTLASALKKNGWRCNFITIDDSTKFLPILEEKADAILSPDYTPDTADVLIVDHYDLDTNYEGVARYWANKILVIDDLADRHHECDLLLDQTWGREKSDYKDLVPAQAKILCGSSYALLKKEFSELRPRALIKRDNIRQVENILVGFGASNPDGLVEMVMSALSRFRDRPLDIHVVGKIENQTLSGDYPHQVHFHGNVENMENYMLEADLAIGGGGTTSWERACLGLPTLLIEMATNQRMISQNLDNQGVLRRIGAIDSITEEEIDRAFQEICNNAKSLRSMSAAAADICDGQGAARMVKEIENLTEIKTS